MLYPPGRHLAGTPDRHATHRLADSQRIRIVLNNRETAGETRPLEGSFHKPKNNASTLYLIFKVRRDLRVKDPRKQDTRPRTTPCGGSCLRCDFAVNRDADLPKESHLE